MGVFEKSAVAGRYILVSLWHGKRDIEVVVREIVVRVLILELLQLLCVILSCKNSSLGDGM